MSRWDAAAPAPPPVDPIQRNVVEKLAEYRARNGEGFVDVVRSKQAGNSLYDFLHRGPEDAIFTYYRQCVELHTAVAPQHETPTRTVPPPPPLRVLLPTAVPTEAARDQTGKAHASDFPHDSGFDFPPGLIPALARAANGSTGRNYVPVHKTDIACARALAEAAFDALAHGVSDELIDLESTREYLSQRVKRWTEDLNAGGAGRLKRRDRERLSGVSETVETRRRDALDTIKTGRGNDAPVGVGQAGGAAKVWRGGTRTEPGNSGNGNGNSRRPGLGSLGADDIYTKKEDQYTIFRKKRSGSYHAVNAVDRGK